jgi:conjugal transfer pilus assembly protein TraF
VAKADQRPADKPLASFYLRKAEGWFWYKTLPAPLKPQKAPSQPKVPPRDSLSSSPAAFSAAWFRENLPKYKDLAWDHPTLENLRAFLWLQQLALDRSQQFAEMSELAMLGDPQLDALSHRAQASFATSLLDQQAAQAQSARLKTLAQHQGLLFFFRSDCAPCALQAPLIQNLVQQYHFSVIPVSLDGKALPGDPFPNVMVDHGQAATLGVQSLPALYLASTQKEIAAVGQGVMALPELEHRLLVVAKRQHGMSDRDFDQTRVIRPPRPHVLQKGPDTSQELASPHRLPQSFPAPPPAGGRQ